MDQENKRLYKAWALLMVLTSISVLAAWGGRSGEASGGLALAVLMATAFIKTRQVLDHFLDLRTAKGGWRVFFSIMIAALLLLLLALGLAPILMQEAA